MSISVAGDPSNLVEIKYWATKLISDEVVTKTTRIVNDDVVSRIVAKLGAIMESFEKFFAHHEYHERLLVDIGVLRFPDTSHRYFKVSNLHPKIRRSVANDNSSIAFS